MRNWLQHHLNALHVQCRLRPLIGAWMALQVSVVVERVIHPIIYGGV